MASLLVPQLGKNGQQSKTDNVRAVVHLIGRARIDHAGGELIGDQPLFDFAQRQNAARIRRQQAAVEFESRPACRKRMNRPGSGSELFMVDAARLKSREFQFPDNQT